MTVGDGNAGLVGTCDVGTVEVEVETSISDVRLSTAGGFAGGEDAYPPHPITVHRLPYGYFEVGLVHVVGLMCGAFEFDTAGHRYVRVGVFVVHTRSSSGVCQCLKEVIKKLLVVGVVFVLIVGFYNGYD